MTFCWRVGCFSHVCTHIGLGFSRGRVHVCQTSNVLTNQLTEWTGNLLGLVLSPILLLNFGWRGLFYVFGFLGLPMFLFWLAAVPDKVGSWGWRQGGGGDKVAVRETSYL